MKLSNAHLSLLPAEVSPPTYDRTSLQAGIVHFGVGQFHRSHQAMYLDRLLRTGAGTGWGIWGVGVSSRSRGVLTALASQDGLYTLTEKSADGTTKTSVIGSIVGVEAAGTAPEPVIARLADPRTRIISLTVTEGGYGIDPVSGKFTGQGDPLIEADLADPRSSASWLGVVVNGLRRRQSSGAGPITLLSCDNIEENGHVAREALVGFAEMLAPDLVAWIESNMTFPRSMVDRVTPGTTEEDRVFLRRAYDLEDAWPVTCEPFSQWVVEDQFANGRPDLQGVGVDVVEDVGPYELMKLRLANGTHQALCYLGHMLGYTYVHEAVADADIRAMLIRYSDEEAVPTLTAIPGVDLRAWGRTVLQRFGNPQIKDRLDRICADASDRIPKFILPAARDQLAHDRGVQICAAIVASWAYYAAGSDEDGNTFDVKDSRRLQVMRAAEEDASNPGAFLRWAEIFGDLADAEPFRTHYLSAINLLRGNGARALLAHLREN